MRARAAVAVLLLCACADEEGILVSVNQDAATRTRRVDELRFVVGVEQADGSTYWAAIDRSYSIAHDLTSRPFTLLIHAGDVTPRPERILVAVIGRSMGADSAFGAFGAPQAFVSGKVVQRDVVLLEGRGFTATPTGCVRWDQSAIGSGDDQDCDGDPVPTDCADTDPTRSSLLPEICNDGVDQDCDDLPDDGCIADCVAETVGVEQPCYTGPLGTGSTGTCRPGVQRCTEQGWSPCVGEVVPTLLEACNGLDDDCDLLIDEDLASVTCGVGACAVTVDACAAGAPAACTPSPTVPVEDLDCDGVDDDCDGQTDEDCPCVLVAPMVNGGNDATAPGTPFHTVQAAADYAAADAARPQRICVAGPTNCDGATTPYLQDLTMRNGVDVLGGYAWAEGVGLIRCGEGAVTSIQPPDPRGILFDGAVTTRTELSGFTVLIPRGPEGLGQSAAVTVTGGGQALLSELRVVGDLPAAESFGIDVTTGGDAIVQRSSITASDAAATQAVAIRAVGARVTVRENCDVFTPEGRCLDACDDSDSTLGVRGRLAGQIGATYAVVLQDSPGSIVERSAICGGVAGTAAGGIVLSGHTGGTRISHNYITTAGSAGFASGIELFDCGGSGPWIFANEAVAAYSPPTGLPVAGETTGILSTGDCRPLIEANQSIRGSDPLGSGSNAFGLACTGGSRCDALGNEEIVGGWGGSPSQASGLRCLSGGCGRIVGNRITGAVGAGTTLYGAKIEASGPFVAQNLITGGCASGDTAAVYASDAWARLENNAIVGGECADGGSSWTALYAITFDGSVGLDVHSNLIAAGGAPLGCSSSALKVKGSAPAGSYRNNIFVGGECTSDIVVHEEDATSDPRVFQNNDLWPLGDTPRYEDEGSSTMGLSIDQVNALTDMVTGGNISAEPGLDGSGHLTSGSQCIDTGTSTGAPPTDAEGDARPNGAAPDIGPDEFY